MNGQWQTRPARSTPLKVALLLLLLAGLCWGIVRLERNRTRRHLDASVVKKAGANGAVYLAQMKVPDVTAEQWLHLSGDAKTLRVLYLTGAESVADGLGPVTEFAGLEQLILAGCNWVDDSELAKISSLHRLQRLSLADTAITDTGLRSLDLTEIRSLDLKNCHGITDAAVEDLIGLESLQQVILDGTSITFVGFERLRNAQPEAELQLDRRAVLQSFCRVDGNTPWLETPQQATDLARFFQLAHDWSTGVSDGTAAPTTVWLAGPAAGPAIGDILSACPQVENLSLRDTSVSGGFEAAPVTLKTLRLHEIRPEIDLTGLTSIESLENFGLYSTEVPGGGLKILPHLSTLRFVDLAGVTISEADLLPVAQSSSLRVVSLATMSVSDATAEAIAALPSLEHLTLYNTGVSPDAIERIRKQHRQLTLRTE